jgi:hypothetical protein
MDDPNLAHQQSEIEAESPDRLQTFTDACSTMKNAMQQEAQKLLADRDSTGSKNFAEACSTMKETMSDEAQRIIFNVTDNEHNSLESEKLKATQTATSSS